MSQDKLTQSYAQRIKTGCFLTVVLSAALFGQQALPNQMHTDFQAPDGAIFTNKYLELEILLHYESTHKVKL